MIQFNRESEPVQKNVYTVLVKLLKQALSQGVEANVETALGKCHPKLDLNFSEYTAHSFGIILRSKYEILI